MKFALAIIASLTAIDLWRQMRGESAAQPWPRGDLQSVL
jgi:hypothetical protein